MLCRAPFSFCNGVQPISFESRDPEFALCDCFNSDRRALNRRASAHIDIATGESNSHQSGPTTSLTGEGHSQNGGNHKARVKHVELMQFDHTYENHLFVFQLCQFICQEDKNVQERITHFACNAGLGGVIKSLYICCIWGS